MTSKLIIKVLAVIFILAIGTTATSITPIAEVMATISIADDSDSTFRTDI